MAEPETVEVPFEVEVTVSSRRRLKRPHLTMYPSIQCCLLKFDTTEVIGTGREYTVTVVLPLSYSMSDAESSGPLRH